MERDRTEPKGRKIVIGFGAAAELILLLPALAEGAALAIVLRRHRPVLAIAGTLCAAMIGIYAAVALGALLRQRARQRRKRRKKE